MSSRRRRRKRDGEKKERLRKTVINAKEKWRYGRSNGKGY